MMSSRAQSHNPELPPISVVVCTRNRGDSIVATIESLLQSEYPEFELLIVDQSTNNETQAALQPFLSDPRLTYQLSLTKGLGRARNIGLGLAHHDIVLMTDDDCEVPPNWFHVMVEGFQTDPKVAAVYCNVLAAQHDPSAGFIPDYVRKGQQLLTRVLDKCAPNGIGAGMGVRRSVIHTLGGFDEMLGAGAPFSSYEDVDVALRALLNGYYIFETDQVAVIHYGFRTLKEGQELTSRNYYGIGAGLGKLLKCRQWRVFPVTVYVLWNAVFAPIVVHLIRLRRPPVWRRFKGFCLGFAHALKTPVRRGQLLFERPTDTF